ncbi:MULTISPECIES: CdaR family protein [unclassified Breznakia]|uniref:CdaR family protein n=1 Tax=unclassified Breznakia TaxID=2623764 RepID=UPI00247470DC|nr:MULTISPECIES: CdaR family protein [unclassified Breznakia]MDH6367827.1 YbbR domain-containing protein [Breznakia sp. PH1-1]MDH6404926.1 YbbR domain-containing protein [Breznakia sp. PF1-11]MDH6412630.1 YbbR domain-containing protein [Breznakia sp. PFB1-11]MDH6415001.1 YbbR domain-containing protein [Breznakia sp. PFB1-14]MDH6417312.1 YbbR domain-containing protein [Breznakia sp. PFB1-4]
MRKNRTRKTEIPKPIVKSTTSFKNTYSKAEQVVLRLFGIVSKWVDRILFSQRYAKVIAVAIAALLFAVVSQDIEGNIFTNQIRSATDVKDIPVVTNISSSEYEVIDLPETVTVTITGDAGDVQYASQRKDNYQVMANLSDKGVGTYEVELVPLNFSDKVDVSVNPSVALVTVRKKVSRSFSLGYDFVNMNQMDDIYSLSEPVFDQNEVIIRASDERMQEIAYVKALIDVADKKADFRQDAQIVAYNANGDRLAVDILPATVGVEVAVSSPHKVVPIKLDFTGELPEDVAISSFELDQEEVTIYGSTKVLDNLNELSVSIPLNNVTKDMSTKTVTVPVKLPNGTAVKGDTLTLSVKVNFGKGKTKTFDDVPVRFTNLKDELSVLNGDTLKQQVTVSGLESVIDKLKAEDIYLVADLQECEAPGTYTIRLQLKNTNNKLRYKLENEEIELQIQ